MVGPSLCCPKYLAVLRCLSGSSSDTSEAEAIHQGSCQEDGTLFSKQRINMPELMIMNGRAVPVIRAGSGEDLAPASSSAMALPSEDAGAQMHLSLGWSEVGLGLWRFRRAGRS